MMRCNVSLNKINVQPLHWLHFLSPESSKNLGCFISKGLMYEWTKKFAFV